MREKTFFISKFDIETLAKMEVDIETGTFELLELVEKIQKFFDHDLRGEIEYKRMLLNNEVLDFAFAVKTKSIALEKVKTKAFFEEKQKYKYLGEVDKAVDKRLQSTIEIVERLKATVDKYNKKMLGLTRTLNRLHTHDIQEGMGTVRTA